LTAFFNPLNAKLNLICHLLALLGAHNILHVSRIRVKAVACCFRYAITGYILKSPLAFEPVISVNLFFKDLWLCNYSSD